MHGGSKIGDDILSRNKTVPSALMSLTSLFGMGRGGPHCYSHLKLYDVSLTSKSIRIDVLVELEFKVYG